MVESALENPRSRKGNVIAIGGVSVLRDDHFFLPLNEYPAARLPPDEAYRLYFPWERMRDEALLPLRRGQTARYQRYDWETDRLNQWITVEPNELILIEGVYSTRPELRPLIDIAISSKRHAMNDESGCWLADTLRTTLGTIGWHRGWRQKIGTSPISDQPSMPIWSSRESDVPQIKTLAS
jgi:hypothetical protein